MESKGSSSYSQVPANGPCSEPDEPIPNPYILFLQSFHLRLGFPNGLFLSFFLTTILYAFLISHFSHVFYIHNPSHIP